MSDYITYFYLLFNLLPLFFLVAIMWYVTFRVGQTHTGYNKALNKTDELRKVEFMLSLLFGVMILSSVMTTVYHYVN